MVQHITNSKKRKPEDYDIRPSDMPFYDYINDVVYIGRFKGKNGLAVAAHEIGHKEVWDIEKERGMKLGEELEMRVWERGKEIAKDFGVLDEYLELKRKVEREKDKEWKKYIKYVKSRETDNPMSERIKEERISESGLGVGGTPRKGKPKTEEERKEEHIRRYGTEKLPPRGTGLKKQK